MHRSLRQGLLVVASLCLFASDAAAEICLYRDADGHLTYSNVSEAPPKDATKIRCFKERMPPISQPSPAQSPAAASQSSQFPKVDDETQSKRDDERRRILEFELNSEQTRLEAARKALTEQEAVRHGNEQNYQRYLDRVQPFRDNVTNHERNIEAIKQELSNIR